MKLEARGLAYSYREGGRPILKGLTASFESGSYWCVAGPNGSGKSTFLKLAAGILPAGAMTGELAWDGKALRDWDRLEFARNVAFVAGGMRTQFPVTVEQFVLQGRYAHSSAFWSRPRAEDVAIASACIERVGISSLSGSSTTELSAGENQLALIARALAQEPRALILDEATANLDLRHQLRIFEILGELNRKGMTVLVVSHDLNLAAEFCPNAIWLNNGTTYSHGVLSDTLTPALMRDLYDVGEKVTIGKSPVTDRPKIFWKLT